MPQISRVKGMYDLLPDEIGRWHFVERSAVSILERYGYRELRMPIVEHTELFSGAMGESSDVVSKEMYSFEGLSLRPEGTAGCVRAAIAGGLMGQHAQKLWYSGPMFRRERNQRGRNRQFYQIGAEVFGLQGPDIDAEQLLMLDRLWRQLGINDFELQINSLGTPESRQVYRSVLVEYFSDHSESLDDDSKRRLDVNPLRILDSKAAEMAQLIADAPEMSNFLDQESADHYAQLKEYLDLRGLRYVENSRLVRGLDYYTRTVFEWVTDRLGAQGTVCAGGRYDGLVEAQGGKPTPGTGFAMGVDRLVLVLETLESDVDTSTADAYVVLAGETATQRGLALVENLRDHNPEIRFEANLGGGSFKAQFKRADRSGAKVALVIGDDELANNCVSVKFLREDRPQHSVSVTELAEFLADIR